MRKSNVQYSRLANQTSSLYKYAQTWNGTATNHTNNEYLATPLQKRSSTNFTAHLSYPLLQGRNLFPELLESVVDAGRAVLRFPRALPIISDGRGLLVYLRLDELLIRVCRAGEQGTGTSRYLHVAHELMQRWR